MVTFKDDFARDMVHTVTIAPLAGNSGMGPTYGTGVSNSCAVKEKSRVVGRKDGKDIISTLQIYLDAAATVADTSKLTYNSKVVALLKLAKIEKCGVLYAVVLYT